MSRKHCKCGIYRITTPAGSTYIGSSRYIERRWVDHVGRLRRGVHHSERLQAAWNKYRDRLEFDILEECAADKLNEREQAWFDELKPELNTSEFVKNVWLTPSIRKKMDDIMSSKAWSEERSRIGNTPTHRWVAVDCSDGTSYQRISAAARAFGVRPSAIWHLVKTQRAGRLGVRFKLASVDWIEPAPPPVPSDVKERMREMILKRWAKA